MDDSQLPVPVETLPPAEATPISPPQGRFAVQPWLLWVIVASCAVYLGNFTMGVDLIPDALPVVGNLDEVIAVLLGQQAWQALSTGSSRLFRRL